MPTHSSCSPVYFLSNIKIIHIFLSCTCCMSSRPHCLAQCKHIERALTKNVCRLVRRHTYWREWPGVRSPTAPPETHTARRSPRGAEWEVEEKQWLPPLSRSKRKKRYQHTNTAMVTEMSEDLMCVRFVNTSLLVTQHFSRGTASSVVLIMACRRLWGFWGELMKHAWVILSICLSKEWLMVLNNAQQLKSSSFIENERLSCAAGLGRSSRRD